MQNGTESFADLFIRIRTVAESSPLGSRPPRLGSRPFRRGTPPEREPASSYSEDLLQLATAGCGEDQSKRSRTHRPRLLPPPLPPPPPPPLPRGVSESGDRSGRVALLSVGRWRWLSGPAGSSSVKKDRSTFLEEQFHSIHFASFPSVGVPWRNNNNGNNGNNSNNSNNSSNNSSDKKKETTDRKMRKLSRGRQRSASSLFAPTAETNDFQAGE